MSEPKRDARRRKVIEAVKEGKPVTPETIGTSRVTLWRDLKSLDALFLAENSTEVRELKKRVGQALLENADAVLSGVISPKAANAWRGIMSDFSTLFGLNAPKTAVVGHVSAGVDLRFRKATSRLTDDQMEQVYAFAASLPREEREVVRDASWFPKPEPALLEGESDD